MDLVSGRRWRAATAVLMLLASARAASALDVTACEQIVPAGAVGDLVGDLACGTNGVVLRSRATLRLNGHTLSGTSSSSPSCAGTDTCAGARCEGRSCRVEGPGEIRGFLYGVLADGASIGVSVRARIRDVVLAANQAGFWGDVVRIDDSEIADNVLVGVVSEKKAVVKGSRILRNLGGGISGTAVNATGVTVTDVAAGGLPGIHGVTLRLSDVSVTGCQSGGVSASRTVTARDSTLTGNVPEDVRSLEHPPRLVRTSCLLSSNGVGDTWHACAND